MTGPGILRLFFFVQMICAIFVVSELVIDVAGWRSTPVTWQMRELMEIGAVLGLVLGSAMGIVLMRRAAERTQKAEDQLRVATGAFSELLEERFVEWRLTPAEADVALFAIKGLSTQEIAAMRSTSEGTIKAQCNAIYKKAGVSGRYQLLSLFVDDLMADALIVDEAPTRAPA